MGVCFTDQIKVFRFAAGRNKNHILTNAERRKRLNRLVLFLDLKQHTRLKSAIGYGVEMIVAAKRKLRLIEYIKLSGRHKLDLVIKSSAAKKPVIDLV